MVLIMHKNKLYYKSTFQLVTKPCWCSFPLKAKNHKIIGDSVFYREIEEKSLSTSL